ncbi:MAG: hypothetical protein L0G87_00925 [Renibacterium salmoninarum]|nr:hypothetical protein [Renibacterium salmoninarum]
MIEEKDVTDWLKLKETDSDVRRVVAAVNAFLSSLPTIATTKDADGKTVWAEQTSLAAVMLAARLYRRRNSPNGVEALTDSGASYVSRYDSDISRLLRIDGFTPPIAQ